MNRKCRVLFLVQYLGPSGAEICALRLLRGLDRESFEARILHYYPAKPETVADFNDVSEQFMFVSRKSSPTFIHWIIMMIRQIRQFGPDMIVCFGASCSFYGRLFGVLSGVRKFITVKGNIGVPNRKWRLLELMFRGCHQYYIGVSHAACDIVKRYYYMPESGVYQIYNGISTEQFNPTNINSTIREELGLTDRTHIITCVASLNIYKNHSLLLRAARRVLDIEPDCVFLLVGQDITYYDKFDSDGKPVSTGDCLKELASELGIINNIVFMGPRKDIPNILSGSDLFVMSSWEEGLNIAAIEAMAMGVAVVATSVGGLREVVDHGKTGYLVESDNEKDMSKRILELLSNPNLCAEFGKAGRKRVENIFTIEQMFSKYRDVFMKIMENTQH